MKERRGITNSVGSNEIKIGHINRYINRDLLMEL